MAKVFRPILPLAQPTARAVSFTVLLLVSVWGMASAADSGAAKATLSEKDRVAGGEQPAVSPPRAEEEAPAETTQQPAARPAVPAFQNLRYQEDWSFLRRDPAYDRWSALKYVPLNGSGSVYASFGGQFRGRTEFWSDFGFGPENDDTFALLRVRLHGDLHFGPVARLFVEGKSALSTSRDLPGGLRTLDVDTADVQNLFIDLKASLPNDRSLIFRVGRQEMQFGKQRLVSPLDWSNTRRQLFDGVRGVARLGSWRVDGFWSRAVRVRKYDFNNHDSGTDFFGVYAAGTLPVSALQLDLYWLGTERESPAGTDLPGETRHSVGARLGGSRDQGRWDFDLEGTYQFGTLQNQDIAAFMVAAQLGRSFLRTGRKPRLYLGLDYASGDKDPLDGKVQTFDQLYPLGHAYFGFIDLVGRKNILDFSQGLGLTLASALSFQLDHHFFWRAESADALYNAGAGVVRPGATGSSTRVGSEIDLTWTYRFDRHANLSVGYSHFFAGPFIRETGQDNDVDFGYVVLHYTF